MNRLITRSLGIACTLALVFAAPAHAQGLFKKLKQKASDAASQALGDRSDQALDSLIASGQHVIDCAVSDQNCIDKVHAAGKQVRYVDTSGKPVANQPDLQDQQGAGRPVADSAGGAGADAPPGSGAWLNYDFVPGDKVLFFDDFSGDHVGDLPTHEDVTDGNATIVDVKGHKYLHTTTGATFWIDLPDTLPDRFTIEATYWAQTGGTNSMVIRLGQGTDHPMDVWCYHASGGVEGEGTHGQKHSEQDATGIGDNAFVHCRFSFDKGYVKAYLNSQRVGQLNGLLFTRTNQVQIRLPAAPDEQHPTLLTDIRIAEGGKPLYDALTAAGRVSTHGILFASGSDRIEGESTPTLKEIGDMLTAHPDLKLLIEGHTDNVGDAASNQALSERRAAAVKQYLVVHFKVDAARLSTKGYGDTKPVDTNDTPEGRQNNRRVELVKQ